MTERLVTRGFVGRRNAPGTGSAFPRASTSRPTFPSCPRGQLRARHSNVDVHHRRPGQRAEVVVVAGVRRCPRATSPSISAVSPSGPSSTRTGMASASTRCLNHVDARAQRGIRHRLLRRRIYDELPLADVVNDQAFVAYGYDGAPLTPEHGGPARLVVPHCISGRAPSGSAACASSNGTSPASGNRSATTIAAIRGSKSATRATDDASNGCAIKWQIATVTAIRQETPRVKTITLSVPGWTAHRAGQQSICGSPRKTATRRSAATRSRPRRTTSTDRPDRRARHGRRGLAVPDEC